MQLLFSNYMITIYLLQPPFVKMTSRWIVLNGTRCFIFVRLPVKQKIYVHDIAISVIWVRNFYSAAKRASRIWFWIRHTIYCWMTRITLQVVNKTQWHKNIYKYKLYTSWSILDFRYLGLLQTIFMYIFLKRKRMFCYLWIKIMDCASVCS
jgi:hypothetical protein